MLTKFFVLGAALIVTAPVLAASSSGGSAGPATTVSASGGHAGGSGGGSAAGGGGGHGGSLGAHSAALSTQLGGAGHTLHGAASRSMTGHAPQSHVAMVDSASKKPGHDHNHDHASHLFLHRTAYSSPLDWSQLCLSSYSWTDGRWWSDCNRPVKSSSKPHS